MFPAVLPNELAFAMTLFVATANGRNHPSQKPPPDQAQAESLFLDLIYPAHAPVTPADRVTALRTPLFRIFLTLWSGYHAHPHRDSLCARVLGFHFLMERTKGALLAPWLTQQPRQDPHVLLDPIVIDALAAVPLTASGVLQQSVFLIALEAAGLTKPPPTPILNDPTSWPPGAGELVSLIRIHDWSSSPLGAAKSWPHPLRTAVELALACRFPMIVLWGPDLLQFYNDAYRDIMGMKHPTGLGQPTALCWPEVWPFNKPVYDRVRQGESITFEQQLFPINRYGYLEDAWFTLCYSPLRDQHAAIQGVLVTVFETTPRARLTKPSTAASKTSPEDELLNSPPPPTSVFNISKTQPTPGCP